MDTIITYFLIFWALHTVISLWLKWENYKETKEAIRDHLDEKIRVVRLECIETQQNLMLAYDSENHQFLGQGFSEDEVRKNITQRFPQKIFLLNEKPFSALDLSPFGLKNDTTNTR